MYAYEEIHGSNAHLLPRSRNQKKKAEYCDTLTSWISSRLIATADWMIDD